jgi:hypothetical protein
VYVVFFGRALPRSFGRFLGTASSQDLEGQWNRANGADQKERPTSGFSLTFREPVRQQKTQSGAQYSARAGDQAKFRDGHLRMSHKLFLLIGLARGPKASSRTNNLPVEIA